MTYEEMAANAALYLWLADQKEPYSERDKAIFMKGHECGQKDERVRIRRFLLEKVSKPEIISLFNF